MVYVLLWLFFAIMIGAAASSRGRSGFGWFLLAAVISPLLAAFVLVLLPNLTTQALLEDIAAAHGSSAAIARIEERARGIRTRRMTLTVLAVVVVAVFVINRLQQAAPVAPPIAQSLPAASTGMPTAARPNNCTIEPFQSWPTGCASVRVVSPPHRR
jgi:hypothetical protein